MTRPVSLIVSSYDQLDFLRLAVDSALSQTVPFHEVIVVDDASPDGGATMRYLRALERRSTHLIVLEHDENQGLGAVRNTGMDRASGDYVAFLDGDDWLEPDAHARMTELVADAPDLVLYNFNRLQVEGIDGARTETRHPLFDEGPLSLGDPQTDADRARLMYMMPSMWARLHRVGFLRQHGFTFEQRIYEDLPWHHREILLARTIRVSDARLVNYRVHEGSTLRTRSDRHFLLIDAFERAADGFDDTDDVSPEMREAFRKHRFDLLSVILLLRKVIPEDRQTEYAGRVLAVSGITGFPLTERQAAWHDALQRIAGDIG